MKEAQNFFWGIALNMPGTPVKKDPVVKTIDVH